MELALSHCFLLGERVHQFRQLVQNFIKHRLCPFPSVRGPPSAMQRATHDLAYVMSTLYQIPWSIIALVATSWISRRPAARSSGVGSGIALV